MSPIPSITLNNDMQMPIIGFGVYQIPPEETEQAVSSALEVGYRHVDTAAAYGKKKPSAGPSSAAVFRATSCSSPPSSGSRMPETNVPSRRLSDRSGGSNWGIWTCT